MKLRCPSIDFFMERKYYHLTDNKSWSIFLQFFNYYNSMVADIILTQIMEQARSFSPTRPVLRIIDSNATNQNALKRRSRKRKVSRRKLFNRRKNDINKPKHSVATTTSALTSHPISNENQHLAPCPSTVTVSSESNHHVSTFTVFHSCYICTRQVTSPEISCTQLYVKLLRL